LIRASRTADKISDDEFKSRFGVALSALSRGRVVRIAEMLDSVSEHHSHWYAAGYYAAILANRRPVTLIRWTEALSLRDTSAALIELVQSN
jgi:hypothetical protein